MLAIVGLGNPGKNYEKTVHNLGYMVLDFFASSIGLEFTKNKYFGRVAEGFVGGEKIILLKPETFMNASGKSVEELIHSLKLDIGNVLIISDDIDLPFGTIRIRTKGSAGTHNGLRDIVSKIGTDFPRIRIGAKGEYDIPLIDYVLSKIPNEKMDNLNKITFPKVVNALNLFVKNKTVEGIDINNL